MPSAADNALAAAIRAWIRAEGAGEPQTVAKLRPILAELASNDEGNGGLVNALGGRR